MKKKLIAFLTGCMIIVGTITPAYASSFSLGGYSGSNSLSKGVMSATGRQHLQQVKLFLHIGMFQLQLHTKREIRQKRVHMISLRLLVQVMDIVIQRLQLQLILHLIITKLVVLSQVIKLPMDYR